ncbi:MAG TPA: CTP synthase, partial [Gallicola sp.]|nr:CTP synthase [Gallicola sp.]
IINNITKIDKKVKIALVGKYVGFHDSYFSIAEALCHGGIANGAKVEIKWVSSEQLNDKNCKDMLKDVDGILVPGGFGDRGIEGKITAARYARENNVPYFGICFGMQMAVVEFARNVLGLVDAHSSELNPDTAHPIIDLMPEQKDVDKKGGTMRLGLYPCKLSVGTKAYEAYNDNLIYERHRHRYEFNNEYRDSFEKMGMKISGISPDEKLVEIMEIPDHPWFVGVQFHPEFKSRPNRPHPLFISFIKAAL